MSSSSQKVLSFSYTSMEGGESIINTYLPPHYAKKGYNKSFRDPTYFLVKDITPREIILESEWGDVSLKTLGDFYRTFTNHKTNWIACNSLTMFLRWYDNKEIVKFFPPFSKPLIGGGFTLEGFPLLGRYKINNYYTINRVNQFLLPDFKLDSLDKVKLAADKLVELDEKYMFLNPISPGSTASGTLLHHVRPMEFNLMRELSPDKVQLMYDGYYALRQDNAYTGPYPQLQVVDAIRAFLHKLLRQLSYAPRYNIISSALKYMRNAHAGWADVTVEIPQGMFNPPIPFRDKVRNIVTYPTGIFRTTLAKPYLDLLEDMGLKYTIHNALWLIPTQSNAQRPFEEYCAGMLYLLEILQPYFYPINLKTFYFVIVGHMMHMHEVLDSDTGEVYYETSADFHPGVASMVTAGVANDVYRLMATAEDPYFFSADGGGAKKFLEVPANFKTLFGKGLSYNPGLKDKPGKVPGKNVGIMTDLIQQQRDSKCLQLYLPFLITPNTAPAKPWLWGTKQYYHSKIRASCGYRWMEGQPNLVGELLDRRFKSNPPYIIQSSWGTYTCTPDYKPLSIYQILSIEEDKL